jgi:hypothetical protein
MERELVRLLPYVLVGMFVLGVLLFLLSLYLLRLRRTGSYWLLRRRAGDRGGRLFLASMGLIIGSMALSLVTGLGSLAFRNFSEFLNRGSDNLYGIVLSPDALLTATSNAAITATAVQDETLASEVPSDAAETPMPETAATLIATDTPDFASLLNLTPAFNNTPRPPTPGFRLSLDAVSDSTIPSTVTTFRAGTRRVYLFISFDGMDNGVAWSRVLYRDDTPIQANTLLWSLGANGSSYFFFGDDDGYATGAYEVRLFVGDGEASRIGFNLQ